jgi:Recombinase
VTVTVTTNTLSYFYIDQEHQALIDRIFSLSKLGLTMKSIAETLNGEGYKSHTGKPFYSELVGALVSKYRRKARERFVRKETVLNNEQGGLN